MEIVKPVSTIKTLLKLSCKRKLPDEYVMAWFVPEPEVMYEVKYEVKYSGSNNTKRLQPVMVLKLISSQIDNKFMFKEDTKYDLQTGNKIRRVKGNLQDFIGKRIFRTQCVYHVSEFFINFPYWIVNKSQHATKIFDAFKEDITKLSED